VMSSGELVRHGADASAIRGFAISTSCPSPIQTTPGKRTSNSREVRPGQPRPGEAGRRRAPRRDFALVDLLRCLLARR
jgi:hypothetical protein